MTESAKVVSEMNDEVNEQSKNGQVVDMPWVLISNQIQQLSTNMNERLNAINLRIDDFRDEVRQRFEQVDKRFEQVDKHFDSLETEVKEIKQTLANTATKAEVAEIKQSMITKPGYFTMLIGSVVLLILGALLNQHVHLF